LLASLPRNTAVRAAFTRQEVQRRYDALATDYQRLQHSSMQQASELEVVSKVRVRDRAGLE
jgi:hypothetical protein